MQIDQETAKELGKGKQTSLFVKSEAWAAAKDKLTQKLVELADITTLTDGDPTAMLQDIKTRKLAINIVMGWVREIEGEANQYDANEQAFRKVKEESIIVTF